MLKEINVFTLVAASFLVGAVFGGFAIGAITTIMLMTNII